MKTDTHDVTITAGSAKERYQRVRELLPRGYMPLKLYDYERTAKQYRHSGSAVVYDGDARSHTFVAVMRRVKS